MDIFKEVKEFAETHNDEGMEALKKTLGRDACKKAGAILDILEIGEASIAHSKLILHVCEGMLDQCSLTMGTRMDD